MPSSLSHAMVAVAAGAAIAPRARLRSFLIVGAVCAVAPDIDAIGRLVPVDAGDVEWLGGHRGLTHSLTYAAISGVTVGAATLVSRGWQGVRVRLMLFVAFATAAHGGLDALTSIGATTSPVQFFNPFSMRGYTAAWHPIHGPFGELFWCVLPLAFITRRVWHTRALPRREQSIEEPLTIRVHERVQSSVAPDAMLVRRWICVALLVLLAFWGWRSEARIADARQRAARSDISP
jgi:membrane-bound metal-dependent hydrolase YbcI (DUF457 family)